MSDLQKYSQDNRIQVVSFVKAAPTVVESLGISQGQNDGLYQLLAKNLESKASVAIVKLPGPQPNRGIVVVALPGESQLQQSLNFGGALSEAERGRKSLLKVALTRLNAHSVSICNRSKQTGRSGLPQQSATATHARNGIASSTARPGRWE